MDRPRRVLVTCLFCTKFVYRCMLVTEIKCRERQTALRVALLVFCAGLLPRFQPKVRAVRSSSRLYFLAA